MPTDQTITTRATATLGGDDIPCTELAALAPRVRAVLDEINALESLVCDIELRLDPRGGEEAVRWLHQLNRARAAVARILAGPALCRKEAAAALVSLVKSPAADQGIARAVEDLILAVAYEGECLAGGGMGAYLTGGNGAVLAGLERRAPVAAAPPARSRKVTATPTANRTARSPGRRP